jgi:hypothetical protein
MRRRVIVGGLALVIAVSGAIFALSAIRGSDVSIDPTVATTWQLPMVPYVWPENWVRPEDGTPARTQEQVDTGDAGLRWRTDPERVAQRFAEDVLGWPLVSLRSFTYGPGVPGLLFELIPPAPSCPSPPGDCGAPDHQQYVWLQQPASVGEGGIWALTGTWADTLDAGVGHRLTTDADHVPADASLQMSLRVPGDQTVSVGYAATNGCAAFRDTAQQGADPTLGDGPYALPLPAPEPVEGACSDLAAAYAFAYTVPRVSTPTGDPFLEPGNVEAVTAMPFVLVLTTESSSPEPATHEPEDHVTIACGAASVSVLGSDTVVARPDGVHVTLLNDTDDRVSVSFDAAAVGSGGDPGGTELVVSSPPGSETVECQTMSRTVGSVSFTIVDPGGIWVGLSLDCPDRSWSFISDFVREPAGAPDPIQAARDHLGDRLRPGDELIVTGYPEALEERTVLLVRNGTPVRAEDVVLGSTGWYVSGGSGCSV